MLVRSTALSSLLVLSLACQASTQRPAQPGGYPPQGQYAGGPTGYPPAQYPPSQYPPNQYPPPAQYPPNQYPQAQYPAAQYPPNQYPQAQYPAPTASPPPYTAPRPPPVAIAPPLPSVNADPINDVNRTWLRQSAQSILSELVAALPDASRARVNGIPLVVDDTPGDVNAFAACADGRPLMAVTDGLLEISAWLAMAAAHDELFRTRKTDEYISFIAQQLKADQPIPRPAGFFPAATHNDGRKVARQHVIFEEELAFILGHELAHHHLGHLPCTGTPGPLGSADVARVLASRIPLINQPNELAADLAGTTNVLDAGARRAATHWSEEGGLLTMRFFVGLDGGGIQNLLLGFQQSHPPPQLRIPAIQQSANYWRRTGGVGFPVLRTGD
jgi:peptidase M48-like protein